jgi:lipoprotein-anchoring transpeptidase ErfK/SrfK
MQRLAISALLTGIFGAAIGIGPALADPLSLHADRNGQSQYSDDQYNDDGYNRPPPRHQAARYIAPNAAERPSAARYAATDPVNFGGGFIEFLFGGGRLMAPPRPPSDVIARGEPYGQPEALEDARPAPDPKFDRQVVPYQGPEQPGTIVIDTPQRFLYLVQDNGTAVRYGIGVGRPGFTWGGVKIVSAKKEWPDWTPPPEMLQRRPDLPNWMAGGPDNPLGARALYLGSSLYRIHGSNEPWTIGRAVSSGCIRMRNEDVVDLYERVKVGTKVVVI